MPGVILLFVPIAEQPTARAHCALHTPVPHLVPWGDSTDPVTAHRPQSLQIFTEKGLSLKYPDLPLCL